MLHYYAGTVAGCGRQLLLSATPNLILLQIGKDWTGAMVFRQKTNVGSKLYKCRASGQVTSCLTGNQGNLQNFIPNKTDKIQLSSPAVTA